MHRLGAVIPCKVIIQVQPVLILIDKEEFPLSQSGTETTAAAAVGQLHK